MNLEPLDITSLNVSYKEINLVNKFVNTIKEIVNYFRSEIILV